MGGKIIVAAPIHSPPQSLCIMEVNEIFSKYFADYYKITQYTAKNINLLQYC